MTARGTTPSAAGVHDELIKVISCLEDIIVSAQDIHHISAFFRLKWMLFGIPYKWGDSHNPDDMRRMSGALFLRTAYRDAIVGGYVDKSLIREFDPKLMAAVESYISKRLANGLDLADAAGLSFVTSRRTSKRAPREEGLVEKYGDEAGRFLAKVMREQARESMQISRRRRREDSGPE